MILICNIMVLQNGMEIQQFISNIKVKVFWEPALNQELAGFSANIWIFKFCFLMVFAIKMLLDNTYGSLNLFEFNCNHFTSLFQAESEF